MTGFKSIALQRLLLLAVGSSLLLSSEAFVPASWGVRSSHLSVASVETDIDTRTGKRTGTSYLPEDVREKCEKGSNVEKIKAKKDGTSAFVDVYEYAAKIRSGEMTWEEVEKADLDNVSCLQSEGLIT